MTDSRLQELKRAWEASRSVEDEAAYLRERVRVGDLTQERLELAAYCGHEGALEVAGAHRARDRESAMVGRASAEDWLHGLALWGHSVLAQASLSAATLALPTWRERNASTQVENALEAIKAWLACPCAEHRSALFSARRIVSDIAAEASLSLGDDDQCPARAAWATRDALGCAIGDSLGNANEEQLVSLEEALQWARGALESAAGAMSNAEAGSDSMLVVLRSVQESLWRWALRSS